jgi:hypothetical protein
MPEALAAVDTSVQVPESVRRAAAASEAAHAAAYPVEPPSPAVAEIPPVETPRATPDPDAPPPVVQQPAPTPSQAADPDWEARYNSMKGRFEQSQRTIGSMQEQMSELGSELVRTQAVLRSPTVQNTQQPHLTDEDRQTFGPELLEVTQRAALDAIEPQLTQVRQENQQLRQRLSAEAQQRVFNTLDAEIPTWRTINGSDRFKTWCRLPDLYSGMLRGKLLNDALRTANAPRVVSFFRGFLAEEIATGQVPDPQAPPPAPVPDRAAAVPLANLAAPGRAKPATGSPTGVPADKPIITRAQIAAFYDQVRKGVYAGRDADRTTDEAIIFAAQREGRVR